MGEVSLTQLFGLVHGAVKDLLENAGESEYRVHMSGVTVSFDPDDFKEKGPIKVVFEGSCHEKGLVNRKLSIEAPPGHERVSGRAPLACGTVLWTREGGFLLDPYTKFIVSGTDYGMFT